VARLDVLVIGSGVAGLSSAVRLASVAGMEVGVLTKAALDQSATRWAQGGVAAVLGGDEDSIDLHMADTIAAGAGLCDVDAVRVLVGEGPLRVEELVALGAVFDRDARGGYSRAREGGHSTARVLHAGGAATGAEVERALVEALRRSAAAIYEGWFALEVAIEGGECVGVVAVGPDGSRAEVEARNVLLATGGAGQLFAVTTNPPESTGDGIAMALRAGVPVADVEFMQFHPTALHHPAMPRPLLSEALRGHGALLRDAEGERFVDELSPRDVVSRAMAARMAEQGAEHLWLDATGLDSFAERFPTIWRSLREVGLDPEREWLPIAPAAHYLSGGVLTDLDGATGLPGLWAAGETACTGVHGANRLASNSLLEGMVFGARLAEALATEKRGPDPSGAFSSWLGKDRGIACVPVEDAPISGQKAVPSAICELDPLSIAGGARGELDSRALREIRGALQAAMTSGAGVLRSSDSIELSAGAIGRIVSAVRAKAPAGSGEDGGVNRYGGERVGEGEDPSSRGGGGRGVERFELANLMTVSRALLMSAYVREETRGAHARIDYPATSDKWRLRLVHARPGRGLGGRHESREQAGRG
jgi:L-aspartate oxidase